MQNTAKPWAGNGSRERTDSMIDVSASKFSTADLNYLMRALEIDVVSLREILVPRGHRVEMEMIDVPAIHYNLKGSGRISINRGPNIELMPHLLLIVPPNTPFSICRPPDHVPIRSRAWRIARV